MRILIAAGGTGGHVRPAIATAQAIIERMPSASVYFVTDGRPVAEKFFSQVKFGRELLFPDHDHAPKKSDLPAWFAAWRRARRLLRDFEPDVVVGLGGYPTFVLGLAALGNPFAAFLNLSLGRRAARPRFPSRAPQRPPLVLLEQNAHAGKAVKLLSRVANAILLALPEAKSAIAGDVVVETVGNPLPPEFSHAFPGRDAAMMQSLGLEPNRLTLAVLGGSQGARGVNEMVLAIRGELGLRFPELQILFLTGEADYEKVANAVAKDPAPHTVVRPFEHRMRAVYEAADVVVCRAGGTTLAELAVVGRPMAVVPYPYHRDRHQLRNAEAFARVGAAKIVEEGEGAAARLSAALLPWLTSSAERENAARAARTLGHPDAACVAARRILEIGGLDGA